MKLISLLIALTAGVVWADELGHRVVFDERKLPADRWQTATGVTVTATGDALVLRCAADGGWATFEEHLPFVSTAVAGIAIPQARNGQLALQVEWFREDGSFIGPADALRDAKAGTDQTLELARFQPAGESPKTFRLKFWVEGRDAEIHLAKAVVSFQRTWRKPGTKLVKAYRDGAKHTPDPGLTVRADAEGFHAQVAPDTSFSAFLLEDRVDYDPGAVVLIDLADVRAGGVSVQALCWKSDDTQLKPVDLIKDVTTAGVYEIPLRALDGRFDPETKKLSFKIWLAGQASTAQIAGLFYGVVTRE